MQRLGFHLTDRCQLDCAHCLRDPALVARDLPLDVIEAVLGEARELFGIELVSLTGGEPTLHPEFGAVLDLIAAHQCRWDMVSNGHRFGERVLPILLAEPGRRESLRRITFSIDGAQERTHDSIRGSGSYREVLAAAAACSALSIPFAVQMAVHARNVEEIDGVALLSARLGAEHIAFATTQPTGTPLDESLFLSAQAIRTAKERITSLSSILRMTIVLAEGWPDDARDRTCAPMRTDTLHIDVRGRLTLCCLHSDVPGGAERDVAGDAREGLRSVYERLLAIVADTRRAQAENVPATPSGWDDFACNGCLARFGKPHWTAEGAQGARALRPRWRGARDKTKRTLPIVSASTD